MDGETFNVDPNAVVIFSFRSVLSLVGITTAVVGYWLMERRWDNEGEAVLYKGGGNNIAQNYPANNNLNNTTTTPPVDDDKYIELPEPPSKIQQQEQDGGCAAAVAEYDDVWIQ